MKDFCIFYHKVPKRCLTASNGSTKRAVYSITKSQIEGTIATLRLWGFRNIPINCSIHKYRTSGTQWEVKSHSKFPNKSRVLELKIRHCYTTQTKTETHTLQEKEEKRPPYHSLGYLNNDRGPKVVADEQGTQLGSCKKL